ncbi:ligand-binding sensor domain-containing diguanylate cyclase [Roseateles oligotrophus]|uniref:diguanylate cyclase n=1 Tax=Roseateles oligotrophus TaxID=1769250 RepID=A0ABT2YJW6_9BURK|nr:ligand-binding sensor domain-containing diguanylate cyclase [Roseateles oligotrophus]MCV2370354.1 diguanylate cyclase [Roseateles oligotrophus]
MPANIGTMLLRLLHLFLLVCLAMPVAAVQGSLVEPRFESVGAEAISHGVVATLVQDRQQFLWIGTPTGLFRYDGYQFRTIGQDKLGFARALLAGRDGRLWIGTESAGLAVLDTQTEQLSFHRSDADSQPAGKRGSAPTIRALAEDRDGAIWVGSVGGGLERFDPAKGVFTRFRHSAAAGSLPDDRVQALLLASNGDLWVGSWAGLSRRSRGQDHFETVFSDPSDVGGLLNKNVTGLYEAADGRIWVGTREGDLLIIDPLTKKGLRVQPAAELEGKTGVARGEVLSLVATPSGQMWVGTVAGLEIYDARDGRALRRLRHDIRQSSGLVGNDVRAILLDKQGWVWLGGYGLGLQRHNLGNRSFELRAGDHLSGHRFEEANVRSLLQLDNGEVWAGTDSTGVLVLDQHLQVTASLRPALDGKLRPSSRVGALAQGPDGTVWLSDDAGLYQFDRARRQLRQLPPISGYVRRLWAAPDGSLWLGTTDGLFVMRPGEAAPQRVRRVGGGDLSGSINAIVGAADGGVWVGAEKGLFYVASGSAELLAVAMHSDPQRAHSAVIGLLLGRHQQQKTLWVDTSSAGLHRLSQWDGHQAEFENISERFGMVGRAFGANLLEDERGRIWTHQHIYDPHKQRLDELTPADGAEFGTGWFRSYVQLSDGRMLFGASKGLLLANPGAFERWDFAPPLVMSELRIGGQRKAPGLGANGLRLTPAQRSFSVEFAALDYSKPARNQYRYRLEGFDADWIETGADLRVASYSNLDPGHYLLRVRGSNRVGDWSPHELSLGVEVLPAWWQTWWARALAAALMLALIYAVVRLRTGLLLRQQLALEKRVDERTAELHALSLALQQKSQALEEASLTDPLTGLRNRRFLAQQIEGDVALALRAHAGQLSDPLPLGRLQPPADDADLIFFLLDIDHFKQINDMYGHAAGDAVLMQMRERLQSVFRAGDYLVRWGGEEFLIVARGTSRAHAAELAERARAMVADHPFVLDGGQLLQRTCSVGFAAFPLAPQHLDALGWTAVVDIADAALYAVKRAGRNACMGVLSAQAASPEALRQAAHRPLADWLASGELQMAGSSHDVGAVLAAAKSA